MSRSVSSRPGVDARPRTGMEASRIAGILRSEIISGRLSAGAPLRQERIAADHSSSRTPVREALRILESEGLVESSPNKGSAVANLDPDDYLDIYQMRLALECLAMELAVSELSNRQLDEASGILDQAETAPLAEFGRLNAAFHSALYAPCGRRRLLAQIAELNLLADRYLRVAAAKLDYAGRSHREHRQLLDACYRRDSGEAVGILASHIREAGAAVHNVISTAFKTGNKL